jgi:hypothetical protein
VHCHDRSRRSGIQDLRRSLAVERVALPSGLLMTSVSIGSATRPTASTVDADVRGRRVGRGVRREDSVKGA